MNAVNPLSLAGRAAKPAEQPTEPEPKLRLVTPGETTPEPESAQETAAAANAAAEAQERRLTQWVDEYERLLPEIEAARPLPAQQPSEDRQLSGADWIAEGVRQVLTPADPGRFQVEVFVKNGGVFANVTCPPDVRRKAVGNFLAAKIRERGNLGEFEVKRHSDPRIVTLQRRGIEGPGTAWRAHGTRARLFYETEEGQQRVFDLAGLFQTHRSNKKLRRYPAVHSFGADHRGGTVELRLRGGMLLRDVQAKQDALRQALNAPELEGKGRGVFPVIHLNTGAVTRELPKTALLRPELFTRPRTEPERYAVKDFFLPFGVRVDEETGREIPILVPQDVVPHGAVFGGTGSGKTVMLSQLVRAAVLQGAQVLLWDAKRGKDMRNIAREGLPGVVHYAAGSHAVLHRAILWLRDELERRQAIAAALSYRGIDYRPTPILAVLDELPAWLFDLKEEKGDAQKAAERTQAHLNFIASQAREFRIFYVTAGQSAYSDGYAGMIRANTNTLVSLGEPKPINMQNLFNTDARSRASEIAATITKKDKGLGVLVDADTNRAEKIRAYFNPPGSEAERRFDAAVRQAPKQRRFAYRLPRGDAPGSDGSWADWTPVSEPSSDSLPARYLDDEDGRPIPAAVVDDPTNGGYRPGARPLADGHTN
ncbi:FtsK/SpoIIIE domain-containing protein [Mycobacteroides abscessus]|uniref:FtsK/SpoIIIE domain-containing protein n=1 Tax=Mycobacteroides abscessus TaxID=36809 RepID=UPI0005E4D563|nr:FtsK/SpoIIIE domain-containing protein [Mycobacteroides abscessus]CPX68884.1 ftsk/SpoIIIE family protein%2C putative [Mycobacteroides abscessus]